VPKVGTKKISWKSAEFAFIDFATVKKEGPETFEAGPALKKNKCHYFCSPVRGSSRKQGCQIFLAKTYQNGENIPNYHNVYQKAVKYCQSGHQIDQMAIK
jgi:hypothetical protein